jgi:hypothetical protein
MLSSLGTRRVSSCTFVGQAARLSGSLLPVPLWAQAWFFVPQRADGQVGTFGFLRILLCFLAALLPAAAQQSSGTQIANPCLAAVGSIGERSAFSKPKELRAAIQQTLGQGNLSADSYFLVAEMMKRLGDYDASIYYEKAIQAEPDEPCYEPFYADYLRNFRGAGTPLFPSAEEHYFEGLRKIRQRNGANYQSANQRIESYIDRGLSALYQQDGVVLLSRRSEIGSTSNFLERPYLFLTTIDRYAQATADLDREADVRDYTSEELFSESAMRLNRPLTAEELRRLVRTKKAAETLDRLRFRYKSMPVVDVLYTHRQTSDDQVTNFYQPNGFNDLRLNEYGFDLQKPFTVGHQFDAYVSGGFKVDQRWGLIEFSPGAEERILNYQARAGISHFFGPDKAIAELVYAHQSIHPELSPSQPDRYREFVGAKATYSIFRRVTFLQPVYNKRFETRGWHIFSGFLTDTESFPPALVKRRDYFVGTSLKGVWRFDFTFQPTWFTSSVSTDSSQHNAQYRTDVLTLFRIVDEERHDGIPKTRSGFHLAFLHLAIPYKRDIAVAGPTAFQNSRIGAELDSKFFTYARWTTFLLSARYDRQQFSELHEGKNTFRLNMSIGF